MRVALCLCLLMGVLVLGPQAVVAQDVAISQIVSGDRTVVVSWSKATGDTMTQEERLFVPELEFRVPNGLDVDISGIQNGSLLTGGGAGGAFGRTWIINVGNTEDFYFSGSPPVPPPAAPFEVRGAFQFGGTYVAVAYGDLVNVAEATNPANYAFTPSLTVQSVTLQENGKTVIFEVSNLVASTPYSVTVSGVTSESGA